MKIKDYEYTAIRETLLGKWDIIKRGCDLPNLLQLVSLADEETKMVKITIREFADQYSDPDRGRHKCKYARRALKRLVKKDSFTERFRSPLMRKWCWPSTILAVSTLCSMAVMIRSAENMPRNAILT